MAVNWDPLEKKQVLTKIMPRHYRLMFLSSLNLALGIIAYFN